MEHMQFRLNRSMPISLGEQIKGQITYEIAYGHLRAGELLPSVRELAAALQVAPMTIAMVYRALSQQGLVVTRPGVGTFVADMAGVERRRAGGGSPGDLLPFIEDFVREARLRGHSLGEIRSALLDYSSQAVVPASPCRVLLVGNFQSATCAYAREIAAIWHDLNVEVRVALLGELLAGPDEIPDLVCRVKLAITVPPRLQQVRALLAPYDCSVAAVAFTISAETRRRLTALQPSRRVGIVSTYPEFLQTIVENVGAYGLLDIPPVCALLGQDERIREMLACVDVVVYASGSESICEIMPGHVEAIEYRHSPEPDSVNRLRPLLM
jgi:DNA-binding transcriptional regulator YhcF (GntR family)